MLEALVHRKRDFVRLDTSPARAFLEPFANALAEEQYSHSAIVRCVFAANRSSPGSWGSTRSIEAHVAEVQSFRAGSEHAVSAIAIGVKGALPELTPAGRPIARDAVAVHRATGLAARVCLTPMRVGPHISDRAMLSTGTGVAAVASLGPAAVRGVEFAGGHTHLVHCTGVAFGAGNRFAAKRGVAAILNAARRGGTAGHASITAVGGPIWIADRSGCAFSVVLAGWPRGRRRTRRCDVRRHLRGRRALIPAGQAGAIA